MIDPSLRELAGLPPAEPDRARSARVRAACHAALARSRPQPPKYRVRRTTWSPVVAALSGVYFVETIRLALQRLGLL